MQIEGLASRHERVFKRYISWKSGWILGDVRKFIEMGGVRRETTTVFGLEMKNASVFDIFRNSFHFAHHCCMWISRFAKIMTRRIRNPSLSQKNPVWELFKKPALDLESIFASGQHGRDWNIDLSKEKFTVRKCKGSCYHLALCYIFFFFNKNNTCKKSFSLSNL